MMCERAVGPADAHRPAGVAADDPGADRRQLDRDRAVPPARAAHGVADRQAPGLQAGAQGHLGGQGGDAEGVPTTSCSGRCTCTARSGSPTRCRSRDDGGAEALALADGPTEVHKVTVARQVLKEYQPLDGLFPTATCPPAARRRGPSSPTSSSTTQPNSEMSRVPAIAYLMVVTILGSACNNGSERREAVPPPTTASSPPAVTTGESATTTVAPSSTASTIAPLPTATTTASTMATTTSRSRRFPRRPPRRLPRRRSRSLRGRPIGGHHPRRHPFRRPRLRRRRPCCSAAPSWLAARRVRQCAPTARRAVAALSIVCASVTRFVATARERRSRRWPVRCCAPTPTRNDGHKGRMPSSWSASMPMCWDACPTPRAARAGWPTSSSACPGRRWSSPSCSLRRQSNAP